MICQEDRKIITGFVNDAISKGCRKEKVCKQIEVSIRTIQSWEKNGFVDRRKGARKRVHNKFTEAEEKKIIKTVCNHRFNNLTPHEIVAILAEEGKYIGSFKSIYRVLGRSNLVFQKKRKRRSQKTKPIEIKASAPNELWSWDITYLKTDIKYKYYYLYLFIDIWSRYIVGWDIFEEESGEKAKNLFEKISEEKDVKGVVLHSDNGGPMTSSKMRGTLEKLGVTPSYSRPRVSNDNAFSESLFKTLKYKAGYPKFFKSVEEAKDWVSEFVKWYNFEHRHSGLDFVTPAQRLSGEDKAIFEKRNDTFVKARTKNPQRWNRKIKIWQNDKEVFLKKGNFKRKKAS